MPPTYTVSIRSAKNVISAAACRIPPRDLCEAVALEPCQLDDLAARIPVKQLIDLYECAARRSKDPFFGLHLAAQIDPRSFGILHYVTKHSPTLGESLRRAARYMCLWNDGMAFRLEIEGSAARINWRYKDPSLGETRQDCEMNGLLPVRFSRLLVGGDLNLREVRFRHSPPKDASEHQRLFRARVSFRMPMNELIFDKAALASVPRDSDPELGEVLVQHMEHLLASANSNAETLIDRAERALREAICEGSVGLHAVSERLGMSTRSVQRALKNEGISYRGLLTNVRRELADQYLRDSTKNIRQIAYLLGYSYQSEFHRAFRSWTSMAPTWYRRTNRQGTGVPA